MTNPNQTPPQSAREAVNSTRDDAQWKRAELATNTTDGIAKNIEALWAAVDSLAGYMDGPEPGEQPQGAAASANRSGTPDAIPTTREQLKHDSDVKNRNTVHPGTTPARAR